MPGDAYPPEVIETFYYHFSSLLAPWACGKVSRRQMVLMKLIFIFDFSVLNVREAAETGDLSLFRS